MKPYLPIYGLMALLGVAALDANAQEVADSLVTPGYELLDEVVVAAQKPVMQSDGAKLTYNVDEDPAAGSSSAMDILKKVPQVTVDGDGNVLLNGSSAFKFQLNGLENPMLKQYSKQILEGMPASSVVKIEVITEPGAKEDAEGTAGIINIVTQRSPGQSKGSEGCAGTVSLRVDNRSLTPSVYTILKKDKFTFSANLNYQWGFGPQRGENSSTATYLDAAATGSLVSVMGQRTKHQYAGGNIDMSWEPNPDNLFTAGANLFYIDASLYRLYASTEMFSPASQSPLWSFKQDGNGGMKILSVSANASYRHNFGRDGNHLVLSYLFNFGNNDLHINRRYYDMVNYREDYDYQNQRSRTFSRGHTVQADYANDFNSRHHLMEVGVKGMFRHNNARSGYEYGVAPDEMFAVSALDSYIMQPQNIYAAYASYTGSFGRFGVVGGLRYEHTLMGVTDFYDSRRTFRSHLNDWVPNVALTWNFTPARNLRLAYQMRISRPSIDQVNPFELSLSPYEVRKGNPDLRSERSHILSLKYSGFGRVWGGSVGIEYNRADNAISGFTYLQDIEGVDAIVTSYANIGKRQDVALTGLLTWSMVRGMNIALNGRLAYNTLRAPAEGYRNHGWSGNIGGSWNYTVAEVNRFSAYGMWNSRSISVQGYSTGFYYYGISAARDFLADRSLSVSISANNFLQKRMKFENHTATPDVIYDNIARNLAAWNVGISVSWKFGGLNAKVKKTGVEVSNDDINKSSNSSSQSATGL